MNQQQDQDFHQFKLKFQSNHFNIYEQ